MKLWGAHAPRVLVSAPRRNELFQFFSSFDKFAWAGAPTPAREGACAPRTGGSGAINTR
jgi:hypothetical protein